MADFNLDSWGLAIDRLGKELDKLKEAIPRRIASGEISPSEAARILDEKRNQIQANKFEGGTWTYPKIEGGTWKYPTIEGGSWAYPKIEGGTWTDPTVEGGTSGNAPTTPSRAGAFLTKEDENLDLDNVDAWNSDVFENPENYGPLIDSGGYLFLVSAQKLKLQKQNAERRAMEQRRQEANRKTKREAEIKAQKAKEKKASQDRQKRNRESRKNDDIRRAEENRSNVPGSSSKEYSATNSDSLPGAVTGVNRFGGKIVGGTKTLEALLERKPGYGQDIKRIKEAYNVRETYPDSDYKADTQKRDYRNSIPRGYRDYMEKTMSQTPNDLSQISKPFYRPKPLTTNQISNRLVGGVGGATQIIGQGFQYKQAFDEQNKYLKHRDYLKNKYGLTDSELLEIQNKYTPKLNYKGWLDGAQHASSELNPEGYDMYGPLGLEDAVKAYKKGMSPQAFRKMWGDDFGDPKAPVGPWAPSKPWGNEGMLPKGGLGQGLKPLVDALKRRSPLDDWENPYKGKTPDQAEEEFFRRNPWTRPGYVPPLDPNYKPIEDAIPAAPPTPDKPPAPDKDPRTKFVGYSISIRVTSRVFGDRTSINSYFLAQPQFFEIEQPLVVEGTANHPDGWKKREYWGIQHAPGILFTPPWRDADTPDDVMPWASKTGVQGDRENPIPIPEQWQI